MNELKKKIKDGKRIFGTHLMMGETYVADIFGRLGYDYVWIDTEHSGIDYDKLLNCITVLKAHKTPVIVRLQMDNFNHTKKVLEMGPDGIIFPNVDTAEYADKCMRSTLYPPLGNRGFGPLGAVGYGMIDANEYIKGQTDSICRFIQIESETAVRNLPEIIKNPYIDGYVFGPCDLSGSIGRLNEVFCEENLSLIKEAVTVLKTNGKLAGISSGALDAKTQQLWLDMGINMMSCGSDFEHVFGGAKKLIEQLRSL